MRLTVAREGRAVPVEVAPDLGSVTVEGRTFPLVVLARSGDRVELEIGGEKVVVDRWPLDAPVPPGPVEVGGELVDARITAEAEVFSRAPPLPSATPPPGPAAALPVPSGGTPVVPPMPGRVVELRVHEGDRVQKGQVLLLLEAMKMRSEVVSPSEGFVRGLRVALGANVRAREPMLFVADR